MLESGFTSVLAVRNRSELQDQVIAFTKRLGFETVSATVVIDHLLGEAEFITIDNTPRAYRESFQDRRNWRRDPVAQHCKRQSMPIIWGQQPSYLMKQLRDYRNGERDNPIMSPIAKGLAEEDLRKLAAYFAAKSWPAQPKPAAAASPPNGIAQCQPCHQPDFAGGPPAPRLAGLSYEYLVASMRSFATDGRTNNGDMPKFMHALTDSERDAMARYLSGL